MVTGILRKIFGSRNDRLLKQYQREVVAINALEPAMKALSDAALHAKTAEFKQRVENGATLDELLPEAFAVVREAGVRSLGMRHFDVQLVGGMALHRGKIAEMRTGEGKTLMATLPVYLNALPGRLQPNARRQAPHVLLRRRHGKRSLPGVDERWHHRKNRLPVFSGLRQRSSSHLPLFSNRAVP